MLVDGTELALQAVLDDFRQRVAIDFLGALPADLIQLFLRPIDERREHALRNRAYLLHHIGDLLGVRHDDFIRLFLPKVSEFL